MTRALLLVHRGSQSMAPLAGVLREKGFEPFVLSSKPFDDGAAFRGMCSELGLEHAVSDSVVLTEDEVLRKAAGCRMCLAVWDGQRAMMARANEVLGAHDVSPDAVRVAQDKHLMRRALVEHGLSRLRPYLLTDPELRERLDRGEPHIVKPRRAVGALCTGVVASWEQAQSLAAAFQSGPGEHDLFEEFFTDNELAAETYCDGRELSLELIRQGGRTALAVEHEKTVVDFTGITVLERGHASPAVGFSAVEVAAAKAHTDRALDALGLGDGCYHVELRAAGDGRFEIIEVNLRVGGGFLFHSVQLQYDRSLNHDWVDVLAGRPLPAVGERRCGAYYQSIFPEPGRQILVVERNQRLPEPAFFTEVLRPGATARSDQEDKAAQAIWKTDLATHGEQVAVFAAQDYVSFGYAKRLTGRPLFLVFEPTNHMYEVIEAADRIGHDVVVFHTLPILNSGPYGACRNGIALARALPSWDDVDAWFAAVLEVCAGRTVAGTYAAQEIALELEARVQEHFGLPGKGAAVVRELLNKVTVRRRLQQAGLTALRVFEESEVDGLRSWPVGNRALFFKPVHGAGSAFVKRCRNLEEVRAAITEWKAATKGAIPVLGPYLERDGGRFFLDEEAVGELLSVEGYVHGGRFHAIGLCSRTVLARDIAVEMGATFPYEHPRRDAIVDFVARLHQALGIAHGPTHTEVIVAAGDGPIELVEMNLRFSGADVLAAMDAAYRTTVADQLVALSTGAAPRFPPRPSRFACLQYLLAPAGARRLESFELPGDVDLPFVKIIKPVGTELVSTDRQLDWIAGFVVCGDSHDEAIERANDVRRRTLVNGAPLGDDPNNVIRGR